MHQTKDIKKAVQDFIEGKSQTFAKALINNGYSASYSNNNANKIWSKDWVQDYKNRLEQAAISRASYETGITIASIQEELKDVQAQAKAKNDIPGQLRAIELKGKTIGAYADKSIISNDLEIQEIEEQEKQRLQELAKKNNIRLAKGKAVG